jgi:hypothetical protein
MDEADTADLTQQQALAAALRRRHATLPAVGTCYQCAAAVEGARKFCDSDCRSDWERAEEARKRGGRNDE